MGTIIIVGLVNIQNMNIGVAKLPSVMNINIAKWSLLGTVGMPCSSDPFPGTLDYT